MASPLSTIVISRLLEHEDVVVKLLLQDLVSVVDTQLLEAVCRHDLEPF